MDTKKLIESDKSSKDIIKSLSERIEVDNDWSRKPSSWSQIRKMEGIDPGMEDAIRSLRIVTEDDPDVDVHPGSPVMSNVSPRLAKEVQFVYKDRNRYFLVDTSGYDYFRYMIELPQWLFK